MSEHGSTGLTIAPLGRAQDGGVVAVFHLEAGGHVGRHGVVGRHLLVLQCGEAEVQGAHGQRAVIGPGWAAVWDPGEEQYISSGSGMSGLVIQGGFDWVAEASASSAPAE